MIFPFLLIYITCALLKVRVCMLGISAVHMILIRDIKTYSISCVFNKYYQLLMLKNNSNRLWKKLKNKLFNKMFIQKDSFYYYRKLSDPSGYNLNCVYVCVDARIYILEKYIIYIILFFIQYYGKSYQKYKRLETLFYEK